MNIAIDLISSDGWQGIEVYAQNIICRLAKIAQKDQIFILLSNTSQFVSTDNNITPIVIKGLKSKPLKALYQQTLIYSLLKKYQIDILFSPSPAAPLFYKPKVVTIHDCAYDRFPECANFFSKCYFKLMYYGAKYYTNKIITVSNFSRNELASMYNIIPDKIETIYNSLPPLPEIDSEIAKNVLQKFNLYKPYFSCVGNWRPRKNIPSLIMAFKLFKERNKNAKDFLLVLVGKKDKRFLDIEWFLKEHDLSREVVVTGFVSEEEKVALYQGSLAFTFPSFYEGFGLPVLEAQSLGVPVLTSNTSSLPEISQDSVLYVDPYNIEDIAKGIEEITFDEETRKTLIQKGYANIRRFSWEKSAEKLLEIFRKVYEHSSSK